MKNDLPHPQMPHTDTVKSLNEMIDRQYSETPSWIELKKWRAQMEASELHHLSLHQLARDGDVKRIRLVSFFLENLSSLEVKASHVALGNL